MARKDIQTSEPSEVCVQNACRLVRIGLLRQMKNICSFLHLSVEESMFLVRTVKSATVRPEDDLDELVVRGLSRGKGRLWLNSNFRQVVQTEIIKAVDCEIRRLTQLQAFVAGSSVYQ